MRLLVRNSCRQNDCLMRLGFILALVVQKGFCLVPVLVLKSRRRKSGYLISERYEPRMFDAEVTIQFLEKIFCCSSLLHTQGTQRLLCPFGSKGNRNKRVLAVFSSSPVLRQVVGLSLLRILMQAACIVWQHYTRGCICACLVPSRTSTFDAHFKTSSKRQPTF